MCLVHLDESNYMLIIDWDVSKKTIEMKGNMIIEESHKADVKLSNINTILDTNIMSPNSDINVKSPNNDINGFICI